MKKQLLKLKMLLVAAALCVGASAWADDWTTVWTADFATAPSGMTYSVTNGSTNIDDGYLHYNQGGGSGNRAINTAFTADAFNVSTNWKMEFDWNSSASNQNESNVTFATNEGNAFTIKWANGASVASIVDASSSSLTSTLPTMGTTRGSASSYAHFTIIGIKDDGVYLTVTKNATTYVDNVKVTGTFGYPKTFNGSLGRAYSWMYLDNISFATPKIAGFVATPTGTITAPAGTDRKFTLSCLTDDATIYYAESDIEIGAAGWITYSSEVTTSAPTIYTYASDGVNNSEKTSFVTGAGTAITLNAPIITISGVAESAGFYYPVVTIASDQSSLALVPASPTLSYKFNSEAIAESNPYTFTAAGTLNVTVTADGFTSNSAEFVGKSYVKTKTIDLSAIEESSLSTVWQKTSDATKLPADNWKSRYSNDDFALYIYNYTSDDASTLDVIDGLVINISNKDADPGITPTLYVGAGLLLPSKKVNKADLSESGTWNSSINISIAGGTSDQIAIYTYPNDYGKNTLTAARVANENYGLYRYSDMLTKVDVYSPASVSATIASSGFSTIASAYALDCANLPSGLKAYKVTTVGASNVALEQVTEAVAAGTGLILEGTASEPYSIPVVASGTDISATNKLKAAVTATVVENDAAYILTGGKFCLISGAADEAARTIPAGKAYLLASDKASARALDIVFGETTGINMVNGEEVVANGFFNLQGQRVAAPAKGLYIVNGKKVIIK